MTKADEELAVLLCRLAPGRNCLRAADVERSHGEYRVRLANPRRARVTGSFRLSAFPLKPSAALGTILQAEDIGSRTPVDPGPEPWMTTGARLSWRLL